MVVLVLVGAQGWVVVVVLVVVVVVVRGVDSLESYFSRSHLRDL